MNRISLSPSRSVGQQRHHPVLASIAIRSSLLIGELLLGKLSETVVVHGNAPHDRPRSLVRHLIGNRARFLCTKAPMVRIPGDLSERARCPVGTSPLASPPVARAPRAATRPPRRRARPATPAVRW